MPTIPDEPEFDVDVDELDASDPRSPGWDGFTPAELEEAKAAPVADGEALHDRPTAG